MSSHRCHNLERGRRWDTEILQNLVEKASEQKTRILGISEALRLSPPPLSSRAWGMVAASCRCERWSEKTGGLCLYPSKRNTDYFHLVVTCYSGPVARKHIRFNGHVSQTETLSLFAAHPLEWRVQRVRGVLTSKGNIRDGI